ncbi:tyrosine-type recombinase/integrase [Dethiosulfatarculus sandiegensis]|uniref:Integrase n=1 Tax=Dethiosulfatarculus sandiegensis TaxID=1429043 RepID=A0A0D2J8U8_9BACT|nr:tyrosine-type recombinase/integrase [Dethiosulfatarculus sandiegensis]KIX14594.1 integrase [Dethiosulfatarculus sandiegensis]
MSRAVEPIRDPKKIAVIRSMLKIEGHPRDYLLFVLGINFALRISDLLALTVGDVIDEQYQVKPSFTIREKKTRKQRKTVINKPAREALEWFLNQTDYPERDTYLFKSLRSSKPVDSVQVWRLLKVWCKKAGVNEDCGTHTLRKTWGYHARKKGVPLELIQAKFGHSSPAITRRYIGITADEIAAVEDEVCL